MLRYLPLTVLRSMAMVAAWFINQRPHSGMLKKVRVNLALAYPNQPVTERERLAKISVQHQCLSYVEALKSWVMPPQWSIDQIAHIQGLEQLQQALAQPNGTLMIVPHLGTWEMMNAWISQQSQPIIMYKPVKNPKLNQLILTARQRLNAKLVATDAQGVKALFKNLKQGSSGIILPDHVPPTSGGVIAPFFGVPCLTATLTAKLAQKTGCTLIGLSCLRRADGRFDIYCDALHHPNLYHADSTIATAALNQAMEQMINRSPTDYMWGYRRFKGIADIEKKYYS